MYLLLLVSLVILNIQSTIARSSLPSETGSWDSLPKETSNTGRSNTSTSPSPTVTASPFWPTAVLPKFPAEFKEIPEATLSCWNSWANYILRSQLPSNPGVIATPTFSTSVSSYPTPSTIWSDWSYCTANSSYSTIGQTTLCDGVPRAESLKTFMSWSLYNYTYGSTAYATTFTSWIAGTTNPEYKNEIPECEIAENGSPICQRVASAYSWWRSGHPMTTTTTSDDDDPTITTTTASATSADSVIETVVAPTCIMTIPVPPSAKPSCQFALPWDPIQEIWYWPTPLPTGSNFCKSSWTPSTTIPPTNSAHPNTAVISGHTLTSPTIYQFIRGATVLTLSATKSAADNGYVGPVKEIWAESTILASHKVLTVAHPAETDLISVTLIPRRHHGYNTYYYNQDFRLVDVFTQRASPYFSTPTTKTKTRPPEYTETLIQASVTHTLGVVPTDVVKQNGVWQDCEWIREERAVFNPTDWPDVEWTDFPRNQFKDIAKGEQSDTTVSTGTEAPTPKPPLCQVG